MHDPSNGRRKLFRRRARIPAEYQHGGIEGHGEVTNISRSGLFLRASPLPLPGDDVTIVLTPEADVPFEVKGTVRWTTDQLPASKRKLSGFGVELSHATPEFLELLDDLMLS